MIVTRSYDKEPSCAVSSAGHFRLKMDEYSGSLQSQSKGIDYRVWGTASVQGFAGCHAWSDIGTPNRLKKRSSLTGQGRLSNEIESSPFNVLQRSESHVVNKMT